MEFWGIEIKPGSPVKVEPEDGYIIHVSQVSLGESNKVKEDESIPVYVEVGDDDDNDMQKLVIGNLSQTIPQVSLDLFFEREFELSHNCKTSSVFLLGYKSPDQQDEELDSDFDSEEEGIPMDFFKNGIEKSNPNSQKAKIEAIESEDESDEDEDDESDGEEDEDEAPLKVEAPSKAVASKKANQQQKPSGGKKSGKSGCQFPCGSSCKN